MKTIDRIKVLENSVEILTEQIGREKGLFMKVKELEDELAKEKLSYTSLKLRANRAETQLKVIKDALNLYHSH